MCDKCDGTGEVPDGYYRCMICNLVFRSAKEIDAHQDATGHSGVSSVGYAPWEITR